MFAVLRVVGRALGEEAGMAGPEWSLTHELRGIGDHLVTITGELDISTAPALRDFVTALDGDVEIDCAGLSFIDSTGLGELLRFFNRQQDRNRTMRLRRVSSSCYKLFEITGLLDLFDIEPA